MDKVGIKEIAEKSGVSIATVSRYFNKPELLSPKTKDKIQAAIKELNYSQDNVARILVTGKSNLVGVIFPQLHLSFYTELLNQLIKLGEEKDYSFIVYTSRDTKEEELNMIEMLKSYRVKGIILLSHILSPDEIEKLDVPIISIERSGGNYCQINNDNYTGGKLAGDKLMADGCEVFIHLNNGYHEDWPSFKRIVGFEFAVRNKLYEIIINEDLTDPYSETATIAISSIMDNIIKKYPGKKLGVFCSNDDIANILQRDCIKRGLKIPQETEIIGYDNSPVSNYAIYPITSIDQNIPLMATIAINSLESYIPHENVVSATMIERKTTL
ncbi:LacI family DNA-binding transcriptional regulator [Enterococcus asini]|uniref:LacI family DNA-binding transcriptional regulator n=1 Tax=Enterococcus asini TaxID=57732 RepID=UPI00288D29AC|nr:LacI family DNA-binding transcriptional regulator [Enterococcus asini]MDT2758004.1 LacI family DNA-binding transcriptional regulator [Enterococcus asini]